MSADQDTRMREILTAFEVMSHVPAVNYNSSGGGSGEPDDRMVALVQRHDEAPHHKYQRRYNNAHTDKSREEILIEAKEELDSYKKRTSKIEGRPLTELLILDGAGMSPEEASIRFGFDKNHIRRLRRKADVNPETGQKELVVRTALDREAQRWRTRELREAGWSTREIAEDLGVHQKQVMRWIAQTAEL